MTYEQYKLIKKIIRHSGKPESFYIKRYGKRIKHIFDKARESGFVDYQVTGCEPYKHSMVIGVYNVYNDVWVVIDSGEKAFDEYKEHQHTLWSGRIFSIIVSAIAAALSFIGGVIFQFYFHK